MIDYEKQNEEFTEWWNEQILDSNRWTTLERIAAQNAWMEAHKRALNLCSVVSTSKCCNVDCEEITEVDSVYCKFHGSM